MKFHPLSELFPLMQGREFDELVADIKAHGLREPITTLDGMILDGRNRWRACEAAGAEPRTCEYHGEDPLGWVVSLNLHRRHLDESQRAIVAAKIANLGDGQRKSASPIGERAVTQGEAAQLLNVGKRSVERAREVLDHGSDELIAAVESGRVSVSAAADVAELPWRAGPASAGGSHRHSARGSGAAGRGVIEGSRPRGLGGLTGLARGLVLRRAVTVAVYPARIGACYSNFL